MLTEEHIYQLHRIINAAWRLKKVALVLLICMPIMIVTSHILSPVWQSTSADLVLHKVEETGMPSIDQALLSETFSHARQRGLAEHLKDINVLKKLALETGIINAEDTPHVQNDVLLDIQKKWLNVRFIDEGYLAITFRYIDAQKADQFMKRFVEWAKHDLVATHIKLAGKKHNSIEHNLKHLHSNLDQVQQEIETLEHKNADKSKAIYSHENLSDLKKELQDQESALFLSMHKQDAIKPRILLWLGSSSTRKGHTQKEEHLGSVEALEKRISELKKIYTPHHSKIRALEEQLSDMQQPAKQQHSLHAAHSPRQKELNRIIKAYHRFNGELDRKEQEQIETWIAEEDNIMAKEKKLDKMKASLPFLKQLDSLRKRRNLLQENIAHMEHNLLLEQRNTNILETLADHLIEVADLQKAHPMNQKHPILYGIAGIIAACAAFLGLVLLNIMLNQTVEYTRELKKMLPSGSKTLVLHINEPE